MGKLTATFYNFYQKKKKTLNYSEDYFFIQVTFIDYDLLTNFFKKKFIKYLV